jgi:radical SAM protein with 4Fe4S-binding SPASM domain
MFTPMAGNDGSLARIVRLADELGIGTVYISLLEDRGRAQDSISSLALNGPSVASLIFSILSLQERYPHIAIQCLNLKMFTERLRSTGLETELLDRTIRVTADRLVFLSAYLDDGPFRLGVFEPGNLRDLWLSDKVRTALSAAEQRTQRMAPPCQACAAWTWCRGGSAAFAWNHSGSFEGEDGYCETKRHIVRELFNL